MKAVAVINGERRGEGDRPCLLHRYRVERSGQVLDRMVCRSCGMPQIRQRSSTPPEEWSSEDREIASSWHREMATRRLLRARLAS